MSERPSEHGGQYYTHKDLEAMIAAAVAFKDMKIAELQSKPPSWVNVKERLPITEPCPYDAVRVLGWIRDKDIPIGGSAHALGFHVKYGWTSAFPFDLEALTHWMPLPEPPK